uniref:Uncharacterized protein n=1 Tax=Glossina austeni TaxID=7395 RepID=A0A1A9V7R3_GLOAU
MYGLLAQPRFYICFVVLMSKYLTTRLNGGTEIHRAKKLDKYPTEACFINAGQFGFVTLFHKEAKKTWLKVCWKEKFIVTLYDKEKKDKSKLDNCVVALIKTVTHAHASISRTVWVESSSELYEKASLEKNKKNISKITGYRKSVLVCHRWWSEELYYLFDVSSTSANSSPDISQGTWPAPGPKSLGTFAGRH